MVQVEIGCVECGANLIYDPESGETVCSKCGLVQSNTVLSSGFDIRAYTAEERQRRIHTGAPESYVVHDKGAGTTIGFQSERRDAFNKPLSAAKQTEVWRLRKMQRRHSVQGSKERNLLQAIHVLNTACDKLGLPHSMLERAGMHYRKALDKGLVRGRCIDDLAAASLYFACREAGVIRSVKEFAEASGVEVKPFTRSYRLLAQCFGCGHSPVQSVAVYIGKLGCELEVSGELQSEAIHMLPKLHGTAGKAPASIAAALIYIVCLTHGSRVTQKDIAEAAGVTEVTVRNRYKEFQRQLRSEAA